MENTSSTPADIPKARELIRKEMQALLKLRAEGEKQWQDYDSAEDEPQPPPPARWVLLTDASVLATGPRKTDLYQQAERLGYAHDQVFVIAIEATSLRDFAEGVVEHVESPVR
jgi:hypothetical protein